MKAALMEPLQPGIEVIAIELVERAGARGEPVMKLAEIDAVATESGGLARGREKLDEACGQGRHSAARRGPEGLGERIEQLADDGATRGSAGLVCGGAFESLGYRARLR